LSSKFEAKFLHSALITLNNSLLNDLEKHVISPSICPYPALITSQNSEDNGDINENETNNLPDSDIDIIYHTNKLLHSAGLHDPISQIYITTQKFRFSSVYPSLLLTSVLHKLTYSKTAGRQLYSTTKRFDNNPYRHPGQQTQQWRHWRICIGCWIGYTDAANASDYHQRMA